MNKFFSLVVICHFTILSLNSQNINFDDFFTNKSLRLDYIHAGNSDTSFIFFEQLKQEPFWGGSKTKLVCPFNYGDYKVLVTDLSNNLLYSQTYSTLFGEWQASGEAKKMNRSFQESVIIPFPKKPVKLFLQAADKQNIFHNIFSTTIYPDNILITKGLRYNFKTYTLIENGDPAKKIDIVFIADGYTAQEVQKFKSDVKKFTDALFSEEPFKKNKHNFNIRAVISISEDSGTDIPGANIWKNTIANSSFYTFGIERYLTSQNHKSVRDIAALVPYDQIVVLVNTLKYGGGGFYNFFNLFSADNKLSGKVFVHEFGHGFGGLADEYWTSDVSVENYYPLGIEPKEPNITTLTYFGEKWADLVNKTTPIPTPSTPEFSNTVGVFEGGGYVEKGVYRPKQNCMMRSLDYDFCEVCDRTIQLIIDFYTK